MATATAPTRGEVITNSIDKVTAGRVQINRQAGGLDFRSMSEVMEFAKLLSVSQQAVPPHCRGQVGVCLGITIQAIEWRMSPYAVAAKSYVVNDRLGYESQLVHAVIEQRAPIQGRLRHEFAGVGDKRTCRVWAYPKGETEAVEYTSPEFGRIQPKNSPLWKSKPDLQLYYNTARDWARVYFPDVLLGVYADDELAGAIIDQGAVQLAGMAGLKQRLALQAPADESSDETQDVDDQHDSVDGPPEDVSQAPINEDAIYKHFRSTIQAQKDAKGRKAALDDARKQCSPEQLLGLEAFVDELNNAK